MKGDIPRFSKSCSLRDFRAGACATKQNTVRAQLRSHRLTHPVFFTEEAGGDLGAACERSWRGVVKNGWQNCWKLFGGFIRELVSTKHWHYKRWQEEKKEMTIGDWQGSAVPQFYLFPSKHTYSYKTPQRSVILIRSAAE